MTEKKRLLTNFTNHDLYFRFQQLLEVPVENDDEDKYTSVSDDPLSNLILEVIKNDNLRRIERSKKHEMEHSILTAAKLISPVNF